MRRRVWAGGKCQGQLVRDSCSPSTNDEVSCVLRSCPLPSLCSATALFQQWRRRGRLGLFTQCLQLAAQSSFREASGEVDSHRRASRQQQQQQQQQQQHVLVHAMRAHDDQNAECSVHEASVCDVWCR